MMRFAAALVFAGLLAACGSKAALRPPPGQELPVAAYGQDHRPGADELLEPPEQAAPERSVELRRRSEEREDDPFDIPPEG
jgi:hypothetical protein